MSGSSLTASSKSTRVYYRGPWTDAEHDIIEAAVKQAEATRPPWNHRLGKPWVCLRVAVGAASVYLAHRMREDQVFRAASAQELADRIARQHRRAEQEVAVA